MEILHLSANGRDLRYAVPVVDLELNDSAPATWTMTIPDPKAHYHPERVGGEWEGVLTDDPTHVFRLVCRWGGQTLRFLGIPTQAAHNRVTADGKITFDLTWSGICTSWKLSQEAVTQETLRSTRLATIRQEKVILEAAQAAGVTTRGVPRLPVLRLQHRQNFRPLDMIQQYCERHLLGWCFDEAVMEFRKLQIGSPRWTYGPNTWVESETSMMSNADLYSQVTVRRVVESGDIVGQPITSIEYGDHYSVTFPEPLSGVTYRPVGTPVQGIFSDFIFRDSRGNMVAVREARRGRSYAAFLYNQPLNNISSVSWTFGTPSKGLTLTKGFGQIVFTGRGADKGGSEDFPDEFETTFSVNVQHPSLVALIGVRPRELEVDEVTGTQADAERVGLNHLERLYLGRAPRALTCQPNLGVRPGQTIRVIDPKLNRVHRGLVRRVRHRITDDPAQWGTVIEATGWKV
jgi:hypothetical protein